MTHELSILLGLEVGYATNRPGGVCACYVDAQRRSVTLLQPQVQGDTVLVDVKGCKDGGSLPGNVNRWGLPHKPLLSRKRESVVDGML